MDAETRDSIEKAGSHLYGLLHARYILSSRGLQKMVFYLMYCANTPERKVPESTFRTMSSGSLQESGAVTSWPI